ncbi:MAG: galM [Hyphomicrobiales bacterium]|nr:galM [Hyphomicrobiales bacterium]
MAMKSEMFGMTPYTTPATLYRLRNAAGYEIHLSDLGACIVSLCVPDPSGRFDNVVLGYAEAAPYACGRDYLGACVGRVANRIAGASFSLDGVEYALDANEGPNSLHGGAEGFHRRLWRPSPPVEAAHLVAMTFALHSPAGDMGYPGALDVEVTYTLDAQGVLTIAYEARCDAPTLVNLTNHSYFNLAGEGFGDILGHELEIDAEAFLPVDDALIPTGELRSVRGGAFDFLAPRRLGDSLGRADAQLTLARGLDHNFCLRGERAGLRTAACLRHPASGRRLEVRTTEPGLQVYSGNVLDGTGGRGAAKHRRHAGLCLEAQHYPDAPHHTHFPSIVLRPGRTWRSCTQYAFSA